MKSHSQFGEDVLLWEYFGAKPDGFFVEVGANHPTECSQTWLFAQQGWRGILVEPISKNCELLRKERPESVVFDCALGAAEQRGRVQLNVAANGDGVSGLVVNEGVIVERVEEVDLRTLDDVLAQAGNPQIDFLSIDVEGAELQVLQGFDIKRHQPAVVLVEDWLHGLDVHRYMVRNGYRVVKRTGENNWYIPRQKPFHMTTLKERLRLFNKMYLGLPFRKMRLARRQRAAARLARKNGSSDG